MAAQGQYVCKNARCGELFTARLADRRRGWARFCSKSCKAVEQEGRTGQHAQLKVREYSDGHGGRMSEAERIHEVAMADMEWGWDGHKNAY